jgi:ABC-type multidrug transport system fused ATPase/permease subunit
MALGGDTSALTESTRVGPRRILAPAVALAWVLALTILPIALWHRVLDDIVASSNWSFSYVAELSPWFLLLAGVAFLFPVAISAGSSPESRLYPRARRAYVGWGSVLYLLGFALTLQTFEVWSFAH